MWYDGNKYTINNESENGSTSSETLRAVPELKYSRLSPIIREGNGKSCSLGWTHDVNERL